MFRQSHSTCFYHPNDTGAVATQVQITFPLITLQCVYNILKVPMKSFSTYLWNRSECVSLDLIT